MTEYQTYALCGFLLGVAISLLVRAAFLMCWHELRAKRIAQEIIKQSLEAPMRDGWGELRTKLQTGRLYFGQPVSPSDLENYTRVEIKRIK